MNNSDIAKQMLAQAVELVMSGQPIACEAHGEVIAALQAKCADRDHWYAQALRLTNERMDKINVIEDRARETIAREREVLRLRQAEANAMWQDAQRWRQHRAALTSAEESNRRLAHTLAEIAGGTLTDVVEDLATERREHQARIALRAILKTGRHEQDLRTWLETEVIQPVLNERRRNRALRNDALILELTSGAPPIPCLEAIAAPAPEPDDDSDHFSRVV